MQRFKNILYVATDAVSNAVQKRTLTIATKLANENGAKLTVMDVVPSMNALAEMVINRVMPAKRLQELNIQQRRQELKALVEETMEKPQEVAVDVQMGKSFLEIIKVVMENQVDLVIKPGEPVGNDPNRAFASNDLHLFRKCPCPLWVIPSRDETPFQQIMALVNVEPGQPSLQAPGGAQDLNHLVVDLGMSLAKLNGAKLHVVQCWDAPGVAHLWQSGQISPGERDGIFQYLQEQSRQRLDALMADYDLSDIPHEVHLLKGKPEYMSTALARQESVDLVVMSSLSESRVSGLYINSSAEDILQQLRCAVMAVKPADFVSPVTADKPKDEKDIEEMNNMIRGVDADPASS
ncbi:MAG: universal stress protein [Candidatus Competibacterales bacterium]